MDGQVISIIVAGLILILNGFVLFFLTDIKKDVRGLRDEQGQTTKTVEVLKTEVGFMKIIDALRSEIASLKEQLTSQKNKP